MNKTDFLARHRTGPMIRMPNAWDTGSAKIMADAGAEAIGTTSAGIVYAMGLPDYEGALGRDDCLRIVEDMCRAVDVPVSVDSEDGYGDTPAQVADAFRMMIEAGAMGGSIEDHPRHPTDDLMSAEETADRIRAARQAIDKSGQPFVLTARAECFLVNHPDALDESIRRLVIYRDAGADCLYAPGLKSRADIEKVISAVAAPINVLVGFKPLEPSIDDLEAMGVRRISTGGSVACAALGLVREATRALNLGKRDYLAGTIPHAELSVLFETKN